MIERVEGLSARQFRQKYAAAARPVILTDAIDHWPARSRWSLDYFEQRFAGKELSFGNRTWRLGEFIARLRDDAAPGPTPYLKEVTLDSQFPELWEDVGALRFTRGNRLQSRLLPRSMRIGRGIVALFIGSSGSAFGRLHWDYSHLHVFISQVRGGKEFVLFAPSDTPYLYQRAGQDNHSDLPDPFDVDLARFPLFANATPIRVHVREGETLYVPAGWWHSTRMHEPSLAIAQSTLDGWNWRTRADWYLTQFRAQGTPLVKRLVLGAYLRVLGLGWGLANALTELPGG